MYGLINPPAVILCRIELNLLRKQVSLSSNICRSEAKEQKQIQIRKKEFTAQRHIVLSIPGRISKYPFAHPL